MTYTVLMRHRLLCLPLLVMSAACATMQQGPQQRIHVYSQPPEALVTVAPGCGGRRADSPRTPATIWVSRRATRCSLTLSFPGYKDQTVSLTRVTSDTVDDNFVAVNAAESLEGGLILGLFTAVGVGVDALSGAMWQQVPSRLSLTLVEEDAPGEESKRPEDRSEDRPEVTPDGENSLRTLGARAMIDDSENFGVRAMIDGSAPLPYSANKTWGPGLRLSLRPTLPGVDAASFEFLSEVSSPRSLTLSRRLIIRSRSDP